MGRVCSMHGRYKKLYLEKVNGRDLGALKENDV
jgi:hypothetical protein